MIILLGMRHDLTWLAMIDIIKFTNSLFKTQVLDVSKNKLFSFFPHQEEWMTFNYYCKFCKKNVGDRVTIDEQLLNHQPIICKICKTKVKKIFPSTLIWM